MEQDGTWPGTKNLTPFQKGQSGNPAGKPKGAKRRSSAVKKWMTANSEGFNPISQNSENLTQTDWIVIAMIGQARKGNVRAAEFLFDARYGALLRNVTPSVLPNTDNLPEDYAPFTIVDPVNDNQVIEIEIGAANS